MRHLFVCTLCFAPFFQFAQDSTLTSTSINDSLLKEVIIEATRANANAPFAFMDITKSAIDQLNHGQDIPYLLRFTPSLIVTSDGGTGIGYTGLWIRGSDPTRINVSINGVPLNDAESQQTYFVDLPDFASSVEGIQIQRGIGTSTNGAASFGGTIKLETSKIETDPLAEMVNNVGSYNTFRNTLRFATGFLKNGLALEGRLSRIESDGYVDRARSDLKSYFLAGTWLGRKTVIRSTLFSGHERTYQAWYGTPWSLLENDKQAMLEYIANNYLTESQASNLLNSGRTYNFYEYENEVDDYTQSHYQLHLQHQFNSFWRLNVAGHYTRGFGYYEQYREDDALSDYSIDDFVINQNQVYSDGIDPQGNPTNSQYIAQYDWGEIEILQNIVYDSLGQPVMDSNGNTLLNAMATISKSDVVRRRWLDNHFIGGIASLVFEKGKLETVLGGGYNEYYGDHFGELVWLEHGASSFIGDRYYNGLSVKTDGHVYLKSSVKMKKFDSYLDIQVRNVNYETNGTDNDLRYYDVHDKLFFFNPKFGLNYALSKKERMYASLAMGSHEPNRNDYVDALPGLKPKPESMRDLEFGYQRKSTKYSTSLNMYIMQYSDQLILTGELNDVGAPIRTNVDDSYRRGIEFELEWTPVKRLNSYVNFTFSENKIRTFTETIYDYTNGYEVLNTEFHNTNISYSPSFISAGGLTYSFLQPGEKNKKHALDVSWMTKYVGNQHLDNTSNSELLIKPYCVNDVLVTYSTGFRNIRELRLSLVINNVLNELYSTNGYAFSYILEEKITERFYYPQAERHFLVSLVVKV